MDWDQIGEVSDYMLMVLGERYAKLTPVEQTQKLQEFLQKHYGVDALRQKQRDDRHRILTLERGDSLCGVMLLHWSSDSVFFEPAYKPQRSQTLALLVEQAIRIAGIWGYDTVTCRAFDTEKKLIRDLQARGFEKKAGKLEGSAFTETPRCEWVKKFEPVRASCTL